MLSFVGSWIQNVAQGWLVYELTHSEGMLGLVTFCGMAPVAFIGPVAGTLADVMNKRLVLIVTQIIFALGALFLAWATIGGWVSISHVLVVATIGGFAGAFEMPARQSMISNVVPREDLAAAVPINAMTFNSARLVGPALGAVLLKAGGPALCYLVNGISFFALIFAVRAISASFKVVKRTEPIKDLIFEGMIYTFREKRLRILFIMESITSAFGLVYLTQLPAYSKEILGLDSSGYSIAMSFIGVGALSGLFLATAFSGKPDKRPQVIGAMLAMGTGLCLVSFSKSAWLSIPIFAVVGGAAIIQFNTTNSLFQILAPERLRGRVIAMHVWALSGVGPFGMLALSWLADYTKKSDAPLRGIPLVLMVGGIVIAAGGAWGWSKRAELGGTYEKTPILG